MVTEYLESLLLHAMTLDCWRVLETWSVPIIPKDWLEIPCDDLELCPLECWKLWKINVKKWIIVWANFCGFFSFNILLSTRDGENEKLWNYGFCISKHLNNVQADLIWVTMGWGGGGQTRVTTRGIQVFDSKKTTRGILDRRIPR